MFELRLVSFLKWQIKSLIEQITALTLFVLLIKCFLRYDEDSEIASLYHNDLNIHALPTSLMMMTNAISKNNDAVTQIQVSNMSGTFRDTFIRKREK